MLGHTIEQYLTEPLFAGLATLMGMVWYKLTARRGRRFEPTLWWLFRWFFIFFTLLGYGLATLNYGIRLFKQYPAFAPLIAGLLIAGFIGLAASDWRHAVRREKGLGVSFPSA